MDTSGPHTITAMAGHFTPPALELMDRRCGSPKLSEDGQWVYHERRRLANPGTRTAGLS